MTIHDILINAGGSQWSSNTYVFPNSIWIKKDEWQNTWYLYNSTPNFVGVHSLPINIKSAEQVAVLVDAIKK